MSDSPAPPPTPAAMLAAVLRILRPGARVRIDREKDLVRLEEAGRVESWHSPHRLSDLARVVAMLTEEQLRKFDNAMSDFHAWKCSETTPWASALLADTKTILAALVAATGAEA